MKDSKIKSPISMILIFCDDDKAELVESYLYKHKLKSGILFKGLGTSESKVADMFGFGMCDRTILSVLVPSDKKDIINKALVDITGIESDRYGLTMTLDLSSATNVILNELGIKELR